MSVLAGPFVIASALLALGGAFKAVDPADTAYALRALGLPHAALLVRAGGAAEVVIGVGALAVGGPVFAALVALSYLAFAGFVVVALHSGSPISSCGCFGKVDTPPSVGARRDRSPRRGRCRRRSRSRATRSRCPTCSPTSRCSASPS